MNLKEELIFLINCYTRTQRKIYFKSKMEGVVKKKEVVKMMLVWVWFMLVKLIKWEVCFVSQETKHYQYGRHT